MTKNKRKKNQTEIDEKRYLIDGAMTRL